MGWFHSIALVCHNLAYRPLCTWGLKRLKPGILFDIPALKLWNTRPSPLGNARKGPPDEAKIGLRWLGNDVSRLMLRKAKVPIHVTAQNMGDWPWPDPVSANPAEPDGRFAVRLGYSWLRMDGTRLSSPVERGDLSESVMPGRSGGFELEIIAPNETGTYQLELDLVVEFVTWFAAKGNEKLVIPVTVE